MSENFGCQNGVKQGGVLSPVLFCIYVDVLLKRLADSGIGCYVGTNFAGAVSYADDLTLLAPSLSSAQHLLDVCESFAREYSVEFNSTKTQVLLFNAPLDIAQCAKLRLNDEYLEYCSSAMHLGHIIACKDSHILNMRKCMNDLVCRTNMLASNYRFVHYDTMCSIFNTYCTAYYGCIFWDLSESGIDRMLVCWRKCIRRLLGLNNRTRSRLIPFLIQSGDFHWTVLVRLCSFFSKCVHSPNSLVRICTGLSQSGHSIVDRNIRCIMSLLNVDYPVLTALILQGRLKQEAVAAQPCDDEAAAVAQVIGELTRTQEGTYDNILSSDEVTFLRDYLCTL